MINFIREQDIKSFQCFDMILYGIELAQKMRNFQDLEILKVEFESKVSYLEESVRTVKELNSFSSTNEVLRTSMNQVSEVTNKFVTEKRLLDLTLENNRRD